MSSGQVHQSWERYHFDQSSENMNYSLGYLYSAQLLVHLSYTPVMGTRLQDEWYELSIHLNVGRHSSVGIATRYGLDGPGVESRWGGETYHTRPDRACGSPSLLYIEYRVFTGVKAAEAWRWPSTPSSAEVKERVELYFYTSGPSWPVIGWPLPLPLLLPYICI
jgi:hypothetical protein